MTKRVKRRRLAALLVAVAVTLTVALTALASARETRTPDSNLDALTSVAPMPDDVVEAAGIETEIAARVTAWGANIGVDNMSPDEIRQALLTVWERGMGDIPEGPTWWLQSKELGARVYFLCLRLPAEDGLRADFCSS